MVFCVPSGKSPSISPQSLMIIEEECESGDEVE